MPPHLSAGALDVENEMGKHTLFLLNPGFFDGKEGPFFCPHNAAVEGLLQYVPELNEKLDIHRVDFKRPRTEIIQLLGDENQFTPVLVLDGAQPVPPGAQVSETTGRAFFLGEIEIGNFLHQDLGTPKPH
jgi:hypothetical protein